MSEITIDSKLSEIFKEAYELYQSFDKRDDPTNSQEFQASRIFFAVH